MVGHIEREPKGCLKPGMDLVLTGYAGDAGARLIAACRRGELASRFSGVYLDRMTGASGQAGGKEALRRVPGDAEWKALGAAEWEAAGYGGVHTAIWKLAGAYHLGFTIDLHRIPVRQETIEICEYFDLNPYRLYTDQAMLLACENGWQLTEKLKALQMPAAVIGMVRAGEKKEICYGEVRGYLEKPREDELFRVLTREEAAERTGRGKNER